jgi:uncharacterized SAM-dependent methyltransferase
MHLVSRRDQAVRIGKHTVQFREREAILTEYSYKYTTAEFAEVVQEAGYRVGRVWIDENRLFTVQYLVG